MFNRNFFIAVRKIYIKLKKTLDLKQSTRNYRTKIQNKYSCCEDTFYPHYTYVEVNDTHNPDGRLTSWHVSWIGGITTLVAKYRRVGEVAKAWLIMTDENSRDKSCIVCSMSGSRKMVENVVGHSMDEKGRSREEPAWLRLSACHFGL